MLESQPPPFKAMRQHNVDVDHDSVVHSLNPTRNSACVSAGIIWRT